MPITGTILAINVIDPGRAILSGSIRRCFFPYRGSIVPGANFEIDTPPINPITNAGITLLDGGQDYRVGDSTSFSVSFGGQLHGFFEVTPITTVNNATSNLPTTPMVPGIQQRRRWRQWWCWCRKLLITYWVL